jgi:hypothetical protein
MLKLLPAFGNPVTAGPAAIAAGIALTALGAAMGGAAAGKGGGGAGRTGTATTSPISIERFVVDPNASQRDRISRSANARVSASALPQLRPIEVVGANTPRGQQIIGTANTRFQRRGG